MNLDWGQIGLIAGAVAVVAFLIAVSVVTARAEMRAELMHPAEAPGVVQSKRIVERTEGRGMPDWMGNTPYWPAQTFYVLLILVKDRTVEYDTTSEIYDRFQEGDEVVVSYKANARGAFRITGLTK